MQDQSDTRRARTAVLWLAGLVALFTAPSTALAQTTAASQTAPALSPGLLAEASWHGRPIQRPLKASPTEARAEAPGTASLRRGTGFSRAGGSDRVRDVQRRLTRLGYQPGRLDGLFGPRTQAAVLAFQRKHGLPRTGAVGSATLRTLRRRTTGARTGAPTGGSTGAPAAQAVRTTPDTRPQSTIQPPSTPVGSSGRSDGGIDLPPLLLVGLFAVTLPLLLLAGLLLSQRRDRRAVAPPRAVGPADALEPRFAAAPRQRRPSSEEREALRERIRGMRADGMTVHAIANRLNSEGETTPSGSSSWSPSSVRAAASPVRSRGTRDDGEHMNSQGGNRW
jgi:Putative peptidoglycan binding domain